MSWKSFGHKAAAALLALAIALVWLPAGEARPLASSSGAEGGISHLRSTAGVAIHRDRPTGLSTAWTGLLHRLLGLFQSLWGADGTVGGDTDLSGQPTSSEDEETPPPETAGGPLIDPNG